MDAIELLSADHERVLALLEQLESGSIEADPNDLRVRRDLVTALVIAVSQHEAVEEQYFWPAVRALVPDGARLAAHAMEQEREAERTLARLEKLSADESEFERLVVRVIADGRAHIAYEQDNVWRKLRENGDGAGDAETR